MPRIPLSSTNPPLSEDTRALLRKSAESVYRFHVPEDTSNTVPSPTLRCPGRISVLELASDVLATCYYSPDEEFLAWNLNRDEVAYWAMTLHHLACPGFVGTSPLPTMHHLIRTRPLSLVEQAMKDMEAIQLFYRSFGSLPTPEIMARALHSNLMVMQHGPLGTGPHWDDLPSAEQMKYARVISLHQRRELGQTSVLGDIPRQAALSELPEDATPEQRIKAMNMDLLAYQMVTLFDVKQATGTPSGK